ncbi:hypothetical protein J4461_02465 [Candidatus Pacearchaeota archaeon]|nr:hypothetical protein [Candidatus Pacearchaeota archaeon]
MAYVDVLLSQWESYGVFDFILPFLLIFAIVFGVLTTTNVFGTNKAVHLIIALVVGILALRVGYVQDFFREAFPRVGVALAVVLIFVILTAIFIPKEHMSGWAIGFYSLGGVAALLVVFNTFSEVSFFGSTWWTDWGSMIIGALLIVGIIIAVSVSGKSSNSNKKPVTFGKWREEE